MADRFSTSPRLVRDLMTVGVPTCAEDTLLVDLVRMMLEKDIETVVVLNSEEGHAVGVVGQAELARAYIRENVLSLKAEDVMREGVPQVPPEIPLDAAAQIMQDLNTSSLFVMHQAGGIEYPAAMLTCKHLMRHMAARDDSELNDLGIQASRQAPLDAFIKRRDEARRRSEARGRRAGGQ